MKETTALPQTFVFRTHELYERTGFAAGDLFRPAFPWLSAAELRQLLVEVLQRHVIPVLEQTVQTFVVPTGLNPLRATNVDGEAVHWVTAAVGSGPTLRPATVSVSLEHVLAAARRLRIAIPAAEG